MPSEYVHTAHANLPPGFPGSGQPFDQSHFDQQNFFMAQNLAMNAVHERN